MPSSRTATAASPEPQRNAGRPWPRPQSPSGQHRPAPERGPRAGGAAPAHRHNAQQLAAYGGSRCPRLRNRVVSANLGLVRQIARREAARCAIPFEDLLQEGSIGLIRAVEVFDGRRGAALSSVAVPYVRGRIRQHVRDRGCLVRGCRGLRELHHRGLRLQQERLHRGAPALSDVAMAEALGCTPARWREALGQARAQRLGSLDQPLDANAPAAGGGAGGGALDGLVDPRSAGDPLDGLQAEEQHRLLRRQLAALDPQQRALVLGRVLEQCSWRELGRRLGTSARVAQRRFEALLSQLRLELAPRFAS
ncbi:sigma-70 family RNA polymerase sigma factor [Vulcanococcus limneticus]|uniref:sigma-70 family RNA polymerase sigma factor n=1 Tax=Vulcanococcus limneticus TaxID=2170428 RepID=UPI00398BBFB2